MMKPSSARQDPASFRFLSLEADSRPYGGRPSCALHAGTKIRDRLEVTAEVRGQRASQRINATFCNALPRRQCMQHAVSSNVGLHKDLTPYTLHMCHSGVKVPVLNTRQMRLECLIMSSVGVHLYLSEQLLASFGQGYLGICGYSWKHYLLRLKTDYQNSKCRIFLSLFNTGVCGWIRMSHLKPPSKCSHQNLSPLLGIVFYKCYYFGYRLSTF